MHLAALSVALLLALGLAAGCGGDDAAEADEVPIVGVPWLLSSGLEVAGWEAAPPSATFSLDTVGGFAGCNRFTAPYTLDGDALEIGQIAATRMACPAPADAVERASLAALERVSGLRLNEDETKLVLLADDGSEVLAMTWPRPSATGGRRRSSRGTRSQTRWLGRRSPRASLRTERSRARPAATPTGRTSPPIGATSRSARRRRQEKACTKPEGVMEQEGAYLAAIPTAVRYRVDGASLALLNADGTYVASYERAPTR